MFHLICIKSISYFWFSQTFMSVTYKPQTCHIVSLSYAGCHIQYVSAIYFFSVLNIKINLKKNNFCCRARLCSQAPKVQLCFAFLGHVT